MNYALAIGIEMEMEMKIVSCLQNSLEHFSNTAQNKKPTPTEIVV